MTRPYPAFRPVLWLMLALLLGVAVSSGPLVEVGGTLGFVAVCLLVLVEPTLAIVLMLGLAPLKTLIATEAPLPLPVDIGQLAFALAVFAWLMNRVARQKTIPLPRTRIYLPLLVIMAGFVPSLFSATSSPAWVSEFLKWVEMLLLLLIVLDLGYEGRWTWVVFGAVLAAVLQAAIGLYEYFGGSGAGHLWIADYQHFRAFGTFGQPNPFSAFMGLSLPLALGMAWGYTLRGYGAWRETGKTWLGTGLLALFYAVSAVLLLGGLIASWGRGAWLGFGAAVTVMVFLAPRQWWRGALLMAAAGFLVALLWLAGFLPPSIQDRIDNALTEFTGFGDMRGVAISTDNFAIVERLAHWQAATYMASARPFTGVGLGNYEVVYPRYGIPSWPRPLGHAHNDYLNLLAETGMIGLAAYLVGWMTIGYWTLRALGQSDPVLRGLTLGLLGIWTHLAVHSVVDKLYVNNLFLHLGVMLGLLAIAYRRYQL